MTICRRTILVLMLSAVCAAGNAAAQENSPKRDAKPYYLLDFSELMNTSSSELRDVVYRYSSDRSGLFRFYSIPNSAIRREKARAFYHEWRTKVSELPFEEFGLDGRIDHILLRNRLDYQGRLLDREERNLAETKTLVPFSETIIELQERRRQMEPVDPEACSALLTDLEKQIKEIQKALEEGLKQGDKKSGEDSNKNPNQEQSASDKETKDKVKPIKTTKTLAHRASKMVDSLDKTLKRWFDYYNGYDPVFTWWTGDPYKKVSDSLHNYRKFLREKIVGFKEGEEEPIVGDPIGKDELLADLAYEMIPYSPEELIEIANREFAWCDREMLRASRDLGYGEDWKAALEHVKDLHVEPGKQPELIRELALEAIDFLEARDLITIPQLAKDIWRIEMMSPKRQKTSPFFLGGEVIQVSFPTNTMTHEEKLMSMRGNNRHFARATVHHELIPGHHLQGFMGERYNNHRRAFSTPFWTEGWALYWEFLLWDLDFPKTPENRIGMLFWRMHRCARIIFSLSFHLGTMTPQECVDFLVDRVGHERKNATAEVRRSFEGSYPPLYQIAYMIGALQFRALAEELIDSGRLTRKEFHDAVLRQNRIPVEMLRARLVNQDLERDFKSSWRFADRN